MNSEANQSGWQPSLPTACGASLLAIAVFAVVYGFVAPIIPEQTHGELGINPSTEQIKEYVAAQYAYYPPNGAINFAIIGALLGLLLGAMTVASKRVVSGIGGALLGSAAGAGAGYGTGCLFAENVLASADQSLVMSFLHHFAVWGAILAAAGLVIGGIQGGVAGLVKGLLAGLLAGGAASVAYNVVGAAAFSRSNLLVLIPEDTTQRIIWAIVVALTIGGVMHVVLNSQPKPKSSSSTDDGEWSNKE